MLHHVDEESLLRHPGFEGPVIDVALKPYDIGTGAMQEYLDWEENLGK